MKTYEFPEQGITVKEKTRYPWVLAKLYQPAKSRDPNEFHYYQAVICETEEEATAFQLLCFHNEIFWRNGEKNIIPLASEDEWKPTAIHFYREDNNSKTTLIFICHDNIEEYLACNYEKHSMRPACKFSDYWEITKQ